MSLLELMSALVRARDRADASAPFHRLQATSSAFRITSSTGKPCASLISIRPLNRHAPERPLTPPPLLASQLHPPRRLSYVWRGRRALALRLRLPALRAIHVQRARVRRRVHHFGRLRDPHRVPGRAGAVQVWAEDQGEQPAREEVRRRGGETIEAISDGDGAGCCSCTHV